MSLTFGGFQLDQERRQLLRSGTPVPLEPKAYELLCLLVERRPRALSRAQIRDAVWPETFISESTLGVVVNGLRQALEDDAKEPRFIRTVRGFGYAFCGDVGEASLEGDSIAAIGSPSSGRGDSASARRRSSSLPRVRRWAAYGSLVVAVAVGVWLLTRRAPDAPAGPVKITPLTTDGGFKEWPRLSPDGEEVAYSWGGPAGDNWDIYIKAVGVGTRPFRLTENPANEWSPAWSPDGRQIAFVRAREKGAALYAVPSLGGREQKLAEVSALPAWRGVPPPAPSWSRDGRWLAFAEKSADDQPSRIVRLPLETLEKQPLTSPPEDSVGDSYPALSPDGTQLAFVRSTRDGEENVWVQAVEGKEARQLTFDAQGTFSSLEWMPDGHELVFTRGYLQAERIYQVSLDGGDPRPVPGPGEDAASASVRANRMVYLHMTGSPLEIWRVSGRTSQRDSAPEKLIASSQSDGAAAYSPNGRRIAFESSRSGVFPSVWICDADGSHAFPLLTTSDSHSGTPRWSPDGQRIVFDSAESGDLNLYVVEADGGIPRRLTASASDDYRGTWSRDGQWIYFASNRSGRPQIWKIPSEGGEAVQVTQGGGIYGEASRDDRYLYYVPKERTSGIWRVPVGGGDETEVVRGPIDYYENWALSRSGLYYATHRVPLFEGVDDRYLPLRARVPTEYTIRFLDFESGQETELYRTGGPFTYHFLAVSPDEEWILYGAQPLARSELMLVENFR
jgi:Tol biopolymer transport system component/DNA-binding winged helix-turn-helix (wHTH) protein